MVRSFIAVVVIGTGVGLALAGKRAPAPPVAAAAVGDAPRETVLERRPNGHFVAVADVNGRATHFIVDTGADMVALSEDDARAAHVAFDPADFQVVARGASGDVRGEEVTIGSVSLDGKQAQNVTGVVLEGADMSLLGQAYLRHLDEVRIKGDEMTLR